MENRRICTDVISEMLTKIPETETTLISALNWNYNDASYKAPEETLQWIRTSETLQEYIPNPKEDWEFKVLSIFTTLTIEELKAG